jgi:ATP-dependent protease HslVU (ClpYQ) peptidase subunit
MTVIAYCKGVMACDSLWCSGDGLILTRRTKLTRLASGGIIGSAGDDDDRAVLELFDKVKQPRHFPSRATLLQLQFEYDGILVLPTGRIFSIGIAEPEEHQTHWSGGIYEVAENYFAAGVGAAYAFTAMECGKSAREAVELACRRDINCRPPVHMMPLIKPVPVKKRRKRS